MKFFLICFFAVAGTFLSACSRAEATEFKASNPLHCALQFESYSQLARQQGDAAKAGQFAARSQWFVDRAQSLPVRQRTPEAVELLGNEIVGLPDGGLALATDCMKLQDADSGWQRLVAAAKAAIAEGRNPSAPMSTAMRR